MNPPLQFQIDAATGRIQSASLYGVELLNPQPANTGELAINNEPWTMRAAPAAGSTSLTVASSRMRGERFVNHYAGHGLVLHRVIGGRKEMVHPSLSIAYSVTRDRAELSCLIPGPGGPVLEAPLYVDSLTLGNLPWKFWGDTTRMMFTNAFSAGPHEADGHIGHEHDTPEVCKSYMRNIFRRHYPGGLVHQGATFYDSKTHHWIAITCRRPNIGYAINIDAAGRGICFDFLFHARFKIGDTIRMPEITYYYGDSRESMLRWQADFATEYVPPMPAWMNKTLWTHGLAWDNQPTWSQQADKWERELDQQMYNGIWINLINDRPTHSGTSPTSYAPDPRYGSRDDFRRMCRRMTDRGAPIVTWFSNSGLVPGGEIDDDWFIHSEDGRRAGAWGNSEDAGSMCYVNPGHPGYIEYTKKWISFYVQECGVKGVFFDCLGHPIPPDFTPRSFMRFPTDTAPLTIRFFDEIHAHMKRCDPEAILIGEGAALDLPVEIFSVVHNPKRGVDNLGPRDYLLSLNQHTSRRLTLAHASAYFPASGYCCIDPRPGNEDLNRAMFKVLAEAPGGCLAFTALPGDLSIYENLLIVSKSFEETTPNPEALLTLPPHFSHATRLRDEVRGNHYSAKEGGGFAGVTPGIYRIER